MKPSSLRNFWMTYTGVGFVITLLAFYQTILRMLELQSDFLRSRWVILQLGYVFTLLVFATLFFVFRSSKYERWLERLSLNEKIPALRYLAPAAIILFFGMFIFIRFGVFGVKMPGIFPSMWALWMLNLASAALFRLAYGRSWNTSFAFTLGLQMVVLQVIALAPAVTDYPASLGWSEVSRYYYASLLFSQKLYGETFPLSTLHPTRYFLQAIPFLIDGMPLWAHRLWQVILWISLTGLAAWAFVRRLKIQDRLVMYIAITWAFAFFFQGAVYYHLQACVIIVLLGVSTRHPWRSTVSVLLASIWAGMSRVNWFPVPAMLAVALYLLEEPLHDWRRASRYLIVPAIWGILGTLTAFGSQALYVVWSGNSGNARSFSSSFTSDLLWYRLLPNATYAPGILLSIAIVSFPILAVFFISMRGRIRNWHWLRLLGLGAMLLVLFAGGLVVSVKIGGGGDLHNMDAYLVMLALLGGYMAFSRFAADSLVDVGMPPWPLVALALLVPLGFVLNSVTLFPQYDYQMARSELDAIRQAVQAAGGPDKEILFISEREILIFGGGIPGVRMVNDYENVTLMEMVMSDNQAYLDRFYTDLKNHRFALIVAPFQRRKLYDFTSRFGEENNVWVMKVTVPLLCEYKRADTFPGLDIQFYVPYPTSVCR